MMRPQSGPCDSSGQDKTIVVLLALLKVMGVFGLFAGVIGLCLLLAASFAWLSQGSDGGFGRLSWPFLMIGLFLGGLGLLGNAWGHLGGNSQDGPLTLSESKKCLPGQSLGSLTKGQDQSRAA